MPDQQTMNAARLPRLLAGPAFRSGAEQYREHLARLGPLPGTSGRAGMIETIEASGLLGRGGAGFPVGRKWRSLAERAAGGGAVVLVNGAEGEPMSGKDRALMMLRPHLVLDGAELAADAIGADEITLYVGSGHTGAQAAMERALAERAAAVRPGRAGLATPVRLVLAPDRYVSGEESAAVHFVNEADARPTTAKPRHGGHGINGVPTLVQNVESLAYAGLIGRFGDAWYREPGRGETRGTALVTVSPVEGRPATHEIELGTTLGEVAGMADPGTPPERLQAVLLGGYFGGWLPIEDAWDLPLDPAGLRARGWSMGCGVVGFLSADACPVEATARIADYMAGQSAAQCGPCVFGLRAIADATLRIAHRVPGADDLARLERWAGEIPGRGACRHPDGAVGMVRTALESFGDEFRLHERSRRCRHVDPIVHPGASRRTAVAA
jgi:NADH:ubiquinone oxidoreductase subunit F (NADH-binding)